LALALLTLLGPSLTEGERVRPRRIEPAPEPDAPASLHDDRNKVPPEEKRRRAKALRDVIGRKHRVIGRAK
jgi:hypothetical protein